LRLGDCRLPAGAVVGERQQRAGQARCGRSSRDGLRRTTAGPKSTYPDTWRLADRATLRAFGCGSTARENAPSHIPGPCHGSPGSGDGCGLRLAVATGWGLCRMHNGIHSKIRCNGPGPSRRDAGMGQSPLTDGDRARSAPQLGGLHLPLLWRACPRGIAGGIRTNRCSKSSSRIGPSECQLCTGPDERKVKGDHWALARSRQMLVGETKGSASTSDIASFVRVALRRGLSRYWDFVRAPEPSRADPIIAWGSSRLPVDTATSLMRRIAGTARRG
jgi:hypothetical protein